MDYIGGSVVTYLDIARHAGVSTATVSRVLSGGGGVVSESLAERVRASADALGYRSNRAARALRRNTSDAIALIFPDVEQPFYATIARQVEERAAQLGRPTVLCNTDEDLAREQVYVGLVIEERVAGVVFAPSSEDAAAVSPLLGAGIPVVAVDRRLEGDPVSSILTDNRAGAYALVTDLLAHGHRRIAAITGTTAATPSRERLEGCRRAIAETSGADLLVYEGKMRDAVGVEPTMDLAGRLTMELLGTRADAPTAIFCGNGIITQGVLRALRASGRRIPGEVAVVGFDDQPMFELIDPPLTVAAQPAEEIGLKAAAELFQLISDPGHDPAVTILPPGLRFRASCGGGHTPPGT
jgi:DNA-binding LacI/PurR family transcriptional regulator